MDTRTDSLRRTWYGYDPNASDLELWQHNRGQYRIAKARLEEEQYATLSYAGEIRVVAEISGHEWVEDNQPGQYKIALIGRPLGPGNPSYDALIGVAVAARGRNPVVYLDDPDHRTKTQG